MAEKHCCERKCPTFGARQDWLTDPSGLLHGQVSQLLASVFPSGITGLRRFNECICKDVIFAWAHGHGAVFLDNQFNCPPLYLFPCLKLPLHTLCCFHCIHRTYCCPTWSLWFICLTVCCLFWHVRSGRAGIASVFFIFVSLVFKIAWCVIHAQ